MSKKKKVEPWRTEMTKNAMGGTELLMTRLYKEFGDDYLSQFQVIPSRMKDLDEKKIRVLWLHDLASDPMNDHLSNSGWKKFHKIVFVSYIQREEFIMKYNIPLSRTTVLHNAIDPIQVNIEEKPKDRLNIVYHTTPHRGLGILIPVFNKLLENRPNLFLHVFSSFKIYGWDDRDKQFEPLYDEIRKSDRMKYYGTVSNEKVREHLKDMHIFAYPSVWSETSSLCLMEAMSAGCACVHSSLGALPETAANWTMMYDFDEDINRHANVFYAVLDNMINIIEKNYPIIELKSQKSYADLFYSWDLRKLQWRDLFENLLREYPDESKRVFEKEEASFFYRPK